MGVLNVIVVVSCLLVQSYALPKGYQFSHLQNLKEETGSSVKSDQVANLGQLPSLHVVSITTHPSDDTKLIYADETALYEFDKKTGNSQTLVGGESFGLLADRTSVDGEGADVKFKYITKVMSRASGVYIFDYDRLRKYSAEDNSVISIASLHDSGWMEPQPYTGVVNQAEDTVFFSTVEGYGHFVLRMSIPDGRFSDAELITAGPTLISSIELSADESYILLADVDMKTIIKVTIADGEEEFLMKSAEHFYPVSIAMMNSKELLIANSETKTLQMYDIMSPAATAEPVCNEACLSQFTNPLDVTVDTEEQVIYVLDGVSHPTLPTYKFSIKQIQLQAPTVSATTTASSVEEPQKDYSELLKFYSRWFAKNKMSASD